MFNPPSTQRRSTTDRGGRASGRAAAVGEEFAFEDAIFAAGGGGGNGDEGPLTQLIANERVYICRSPVSFKEPVANKHYQQPAVQEVLRQIKGLGGGDWCIWELLNRKESLIHKISKEVRGQVLPYRVPELGILTVSFLIGFISSILYWLNMDRQNLAIITVHDDCDSHQSLLYALCAVLRCRGLAGGVDFDVWLDAVHRNVSEKLLRGSALPQVRSPLATSHTHGMEPFMVRPQQLLPSGQRQLRYLHALLRDPDFVQHRDVRAYKLKCVMLDDFLGPASSVVVEIYHLNNTPLENGQLLTTDFLKRRKEHHKTSRTPDVTAIRGDDEWEHIWWRHLKDYQKRYKRVFKSKDAAGGHSSYLVAAYEAFRARKDPRRHKPLLTTAGELALTGASLESSGAFRSDQSITLLPTCSSLVAETLGQRDTVQGACCQWNFASQNLTISGDVLILVRQILPVREAPLRLWANGDVSFATPNKLCDYATERGGGRAAAVVGDLYSLTALHTLNTSFLGSECLELGVQDFNFYSPSPHDHHPPISLVGIVNPNFRMHLILAAIDDPPELRPQTAACGGPATGNTTATPGAAGGAACELEDGDFLSPLNVPSPSHSSHGGMVPPLNLAFANNAPDSAELTQQTTGRKNRGLGKTLIDTNRKFFKLTGEKSSRKRELPERLTVDLEEWLRDCVWREKNRRLCFDLRGDVAEFIARHCVVPDTAADEWSEQANCTKQEMIVCLKCCDNTFASAAMAEKLFGHDSSFIEAKNKEKRPSRSLKTLINKLTFTVNPFKHSATIAGAGGSTGRHEATHRRTGSFDDVDVLHRGESAVSDDHPLCRSPPARMPSRKTDFFRSPNQAARQRLDFDLEIAQSKSRRLSLDDRTVPDSELPTTFLPINAKRRDNHPQADLDCTTKSSESSSIVLASVAKTPAAKTTNVLIGNPYEPPRVQTATRPDASTEASSDGQRTADLLPQPEELPIPVRPTPPAVDPVPPPANPDPPRASLPNALMAALNTGQNQLKKRADPTASQDGGTQTRPRMAPDLKSALLSRASAPAETNEPSAPGGDPVDSGGPPKMAASLREGISGGLASLKKSAAVTTAPTRKTDGAAAAGSKLLKGTNPEAPNAGGGGLAALFAKRAGVADSKTAGEPVRKAPLGRKLFWKPLETANLDETIFGELGDASRVIFAVDRENLSKVFSKDTKKAGSKRGSQGTANLTSPTEEDSGKKKVTVVDDRRAQNVGIVVLRLKTTPTELANQLTSMEFREELAADMLEKLESIFFTEDEEAALEQHLRTGSPDDLRDVPERRLLPLRSAMLPRGRARTRILGADLKWQVWVDEMQACLDIIRCASREMRSCACFRAMLSAVLRWGNFVNYGSNELHIKAITLSSLLKLTEFKTTIDAKVTSLHYIVATLLASAEQMDDALAFAGMTNEMRSVKGAAKVTSEVLESTWKQLQSAREMVRVEMTAHIAAYEDKVLPDGSRKNCGLAKLTAISERMRADVERLELVSADTMGLVQSTARFFGDEEAAAGVSIGGGRQFFVGNVFMTLDEFLRKFDDCVKDIVRRTALYASILSEEQTPQLVKFVTAYTGKPLSKSAMMAIEANRDFNKIERAKCG